MTATTSVDASTSARGVPVLKVSGLSKTFGPVRAVDEVSLEIRRNEVVGLVGENGAGKSTLLKILTGLEQADSGEIETNGSVARFRRPQDAVAAGIGVVHQEQSLLTNLSVAENIAMNASSQTGSSRWGVYRWRRIVQEAADVLTKVGADIDPRTVVSDLSFVDRQMVEVARALRTDAAGSRAPLVILDEPTSVLEGSEIEVLEREIRSIREIGSVIFVSHRLEEVLRVCDRIVVMRNGCLVADRRADSVTEDDLFQLMIGHESRATPRASRSTSGTEEPVVEVQELRRKGVFQDVSFSVPRGRCLAIVGTLGSGRESVCRAVFGAEPFDGGRITIDGRRARGWSVRKAVDAGIAYVPSERRVEGMVGGMTAAENLTLAYPGKGLFGLFFWSRTRAGAVEEWFERLDVRPRSPRLRLDRFSGGNQQKVVLAKWLQAPDLKVLILDHPLRGLDPGAAETVNSQIRAACEDGKAVIILADTLEEALSSADDVIVMRDGGVAATFDLSNDSPTSLDLLELMV